MKTLLYIYIYKKKAESEMGLSYFILLKNEYWIETNIYSQMTWKYGTEN